MKSPFQSRIRQSRIRQSRIRQSRIRSIVLILSLSILSAVAYGQENTDNSSSQQLPPTNPALTPAIPQPNPNPSGLQGGITQADYQPLINLIQSVIDSDSWQDSGGEGAILAYPAGVHVDASKAIANATNSLEFKKAGKLLADLPAGLRKLSLKRLLMEADRAASLGRPISSDLQNMAGIWQIQYVIYASATRDIIIAGPAGPYRTDDKGNAVNRSNGQPVLRLDDFVECLRNATGLKNTRGKFGCSIVPRQQSLAAAQQFLTRRPEGGKEWAESLRKVMGAQDVVVNGIDRTSHAAAVLVEADLLMKNIGMGLKPSIKAVPNYFDRCEKTIASGKRDSLVRWWFTVDYDSLATDPDQQRFEFARGSVKVLSENEHMNQLGQRIHLGQSDPATAGFADDFSDNFDEMAKTYPVFAQLRNVFDLAMVAGIVHHFELDQESELDQFFTASRRRPAGSTGTLLEHYQPEPYPAVEEVDSILNYRRLTFSKNGKRYRQQLLAVSGGVEFNFSTRIEAMQRNVRSRSTFPNVEQKEQTDAWWWQ